MDPKLFNGMMEMMEMDRKAHQASFDKVNDSIDKLTLQIGQLTTQVNLTAKNLDRIAQSLEAQIKLSQSQSENIAELTKLATALVAKK